MTIGSSLAVAAPAHAAPAVQFALVYYDSPGKDTRSNKSLNAEYVRLKNMTARTINLKNWSVRDKAGHVYRFTGDYKIYAGKQVILHTGRGTDGKPDRRHRYWNSGNYIWNNTGDTAYLRNSAGKRVDSCTWGRSGSYTYC